MSEGSRGRHFSLRPRIVYAAVAVLAFAGLAVWAVLTTNKDANGYTLTDARLVDDTASAGLPAVRAYQARVAAVLQSGQPVMQVEQPTDQQTKALDILVADARLSELAYDETGQAYRLEVMQSARLPEGQVTDALAACARSVCYRLDMYNFTRNTAVLAVADLDAGRLLALETTDAQPDLPPRLTKLAADIAGNNGAVKQSLKKYGLRQPLMAGTKTSLQKTVCEKRRHLCVAPTYVEADERRALWVIVDLTDFKVVGTAWTTWQDQPAAVTERQLAAQVATAYCGTVERVRQGDWSFAYTLTGSDGLEIRDVAYKGRPVVASAKNVDWHVSYSSRDGFGYSDAVGCPEFSTAAVVPAGPPRVSTGPDGQVLLTIDFKGERWPEPCNYYYRQQFQLNADGSFRPAVANIGRGCGDDGTYRPVTRIALPASANGFVRPDAANARLDAESWWQPADCAGGQGCATLRYQPAAGPARYAVEPGNGQFADGGRGDNPFLYLTAAPRDQKPEGQNDLLTIGPCCNTDYRQGPENFLSDERLSGRQPVLWYVAQLKNSGTAGEEYCWAGGRNEAGRYRTEEYPCYSGPLLRPL